MSVGGVAAYVNKFLDCEKLKGDLVNHVAEWLRGRPRWTATFLEVFFVREIKRHQEMARGRFDKGEVSLIQALNRYICSHTEPEIDMSKKRQSLTFDRTSAYAAIERMAKNSSQDYWDVRDEMRQAIFRFALSGKKSVIGTRVAELIQGGVASVDFELGELTDKHGKGKIDEPLIVQAGISFFGLQKNVESNFTNSSGPSDAGIRFEQYILPGIQTNFTKMVASRASDVLFCGLDDDERQKQVALMKQAAVPKWSSYGVMAVDTRSNVLGTIKWIKDSLDARFDGTVAPFCYPDTYFGPDLMFMMRTPAYDYYLFVASQAIFKNDASQLEALRTVLPRLFYHQDRENNGGLHKNLAEEEKNAWVKVEEKLFEMDALKDGTERCKRRGDDPAQPAAKRTRGIVRFVVQYANLTSNGAAGPAAFDSVTAEDTCSSSCKCQKHDLLITIDSQSADELLGKDGQQLLRLVKEDSNS